MDSQLYCKMTNTFYYCQLNNHGNTSKALNFDESNELKDSVNWMEIKGNNVTKFPEEIFHNYKNVIQFLFIHTELDDIFESNFENAFELEELLLFKNKLTKLNSNIFKNLKNLKSLDLRYNLIEIISSDVFHGLRSLESIYLDNNNLKTVELGVFYNLTISSLNLGNNQLINFDCKNMNVARLDLRNNLLTKTIKVDGVIEEIKVDYNNLTTVELFDSNIVVSSLNNTEDFHVVVLNE